MKTKKQTMRFSLIMLGCFMMLVFFSRYVDDTLPVAVGTDSKGKQVIILDAGHGGMDSGAVGLSGVYEKDINLAIVKKLEKMLEFSGFGVVLTRSEDKSIHDNDVSGIANQKKSDMRNRLEIINSYPQGIFFSIHQNKFTQPKYYGGQMFYNNNHSDNQKLAQIIQDNFAILQEGNNREIKLSGDELFLFKDTKIPSVLIECGFLSNPEEEARLSDEAYQQQLSFTIYKSLMEYLQVKTPSETSNTSDLVISSESEIAT